MEVQKILDVYWSSEETEEITTNNNSENKSTISHSQRESISKVHEEPLSERPMNQEWSNKEKSKHVSEKKM